ncbi:hypothetical protein CKO15_01410 [Halorhodospira abdelmalekii]|uniref:peptidoglycan DD-metalloendopeptidase family protein n=1 Tax=Halorhodospira abdelmalekii TaxID=421629 RepID=UPI0019034EF6|nr:peptidoglycan DD-metalloendopeptidase family protein [Halorhodospira abdelmalekii]MBK1733959.1 hypothetical protein [Halorhodospira abdelmalekii]
MSFRRWLLQVVLSLLLAALASGCGLMWRGDWEADGHRRIYLYEVEAGDTLHSIAWRHGLRVEQLVSWNQIENPDHIRVGQRLVLNPPAGGRRERPSDADEAERSARAESPHDAPTTAPPPPPRRLPDHQLEWTWPAEGEIIRAYATDSGGKSGIQIGGSAGDPIRAAAAGEVVYSGSGLRGYGNLVIIMHDDDYLSAYGYNRRILVAEGDRVSAGDRIAEMGYASGSEQASLHFEIRIGGQAVDPEDYLPE